MVDLSENENFELPVKKASKPISINVINNISNMKDNVPMEIAVKSFSDGATSKDNSSI